MYRLQKRDHLKILSIIPARSGSTGIKNKNIKILGNKPLLYYSIRESLQSRVTRTIVSTDDKKIAKIAQKFGAEVPFLRPKKFATSTSPSMSVILHCLDYLKKNENYVADYVVFLQPTSPFRKFEDINNGLKKIIDENATSLVGIMEAIQHPYWMFKKKSDRLVEFLKIKNKPLRRQDLSKLYCINDALFITKGEYYENALYSDPIFDVTDLVGLEMDYFNSFDINTTMDFQLAKLLIQLTKKKH